MTGDGAPDNDSNQTETEGGANGGGPMDAVKKALYAASDVVFVFWTVFINFAGGVFGIGLILNLTGFGCARCLRALSDIGMP